MTQTNTQELPKPGKGKAFFERAEQVAETGNWDFAVELYVEGIKREPDNVIQGHQPLREVALKRKAQGGKGPGMGDKFKHRPVKDPLANLVNASFLLAKEPGSVQFMNQVRQNAVRLELPRVTKWVCDILVESQRQTKKPNVRLLMSVAESYEDIKELRSAIVACDMAKAADPDNAEIQRKSGQLGADYTIQKGKYGEEGEFTKGVADMDAQKELIERDKLIQGQQFLIDEIDKARKQYVASPDVHGKINALVDALLKIPEESYENEAIDVLTKAHLDTNAYQFKLRIGDIRIRQMTRRYRKLRKDGDKQAAVKQAQAQLAFELAEFKERSINYPTDLALKFELGKRQLLAGQHDKAIGSLQQAQRDPRRHIAAMSFLGQAFEAKDLPREAADTYERALETEMTEDRAKELRYNLGNVLESMGELERARDEFSTVAQTDYNYRDVRQRLDAINKAIQERDNAAQGQ